MDCHFVQPALASPGFEKLTNPADLFFFITEKTDFGKRSRRVSSPISSGIPVTQSLIGLTGLDLAVCEELVAGFTLRDFSPTKSTK